MKNCFLLISISFFAFSCAGGGSSNNANNTNNINNTGDGSFGDICQEGSTCQSGYCIFFNDSDQNKCTRLCETQDCPNGFTCRKASRTDETAICLPVSDHVCTSCNTDGDCGEHSNRCFEINEYRSCLLECSIEIYCPSGYACTQLDSVSGNGGFFCLPSAGDCGCTQDNAGTVRSCKIENQYGSCSGEQECLGAEGWGECDAQTPTEEICDYQDNNCNGEIDEGVIGTLEHCEDCNLPCAGAEVAGTEIECINQSCYLTCEADYYNADATDSNGCECVDDSTGGSSTASSEHLGSFTDCDFSYNVNNLFVPADENKQAGPDYFKYNYENVYDPNCWAYNKVKLDVPAAGALLKLCGGDSTSETTWDCITVNPGSQDELEMPVPGNGSSVTMYFKVERVGITANCGPYSLMVFDDGDL
ncbi:MAG: hypothetical protein ACQES9_00965 [Myxococcota bacterium]